MSVDENDERVALKIVWSLQNLQLFHNLSNNMLMRLHIPQCCDDCRNWSADSEHRLQLNTFSDELGKVL